jgi:hypothetical protein
MLFLSATLHEYPQMNTRSALPLATKGTQEFFKNNIYETFMVIHDYLCSAAGIDCHRRFCLRRYTNIHK